MTLTQVRVRYAQVLIATVLCAVCSGLLPRSVDAADRSETGRARHGDVAEGTLFLRAEGAGESVKAPTLKTDVHVQVTGLIARVEVRQEFTNAASTWAEGIYTFPLPETGAVDHLRMRIGERVIEGMIKERAEAKKTYEQAKAQGKRTSLLEQERPNIFTTSVANIPPGELIFNTDWDDFPRLYYYDPTHFYTSGLDPTYLLDKNPELSKLYERITTGEEEDPGPLIRDRFGTRWIFSDNTKDHDGFFDNALRSGWFDRVYEDGDCSVLHIRDQKSEPPPEEKNDNADDGDNKNDNSP